MSKKQKRKIRKLRERVRELEAQHKWDALDMEQLRDTVRRLSACTDTRDWSDYTINGVKPLTSSVAWEDGKLQKTLNAQPVPPERVFVPSMWTDETVPTTLRQFRG